MGPCAKAIVRCTITSPGGVKYVGQNDCLTPQPVCPRLPGEGYEKCTTVCHQQGHAEFQALFKAGADAYGATAVIEGHTYACRACQEALYGAGVLTLRVMPRAPAKRAQDVLMTTQPMPEGGITLADVLAGK